MTEYLSDIDPLAVEARIIHCLEQAAFHLDKAAAGLSLIEGAVEPGTGKLILPLDHDGLIRAQGTVNGLAQLATAYATLASAYQAHNG